MTFAEFLEKCREVDGWELDARHLRNKDNDCPLQAVFGWTGYIDRAREAGLDFEAIMDAADGYKDNEVRKALLGLVKS